MSTPSPSAPQRLSSQDLIKLKKYLTDHLLRAMELEGVASSQRSSFIQQNISNVYEQTQLRLPEDLKKDIFGQVIDDLLGFGPIQVLLDDPEVTEIMVNGPKKIFIEKKGQLTKSNAVFDDDDHVLRIIDRIILPLGRRVDGDSPTVD
ncbi:MAG TPA: CpaF family protein, partial [Anaerolineales bacterium]|nr:CpaF family protein [Anaerolineales bacterium]